MLRYTFCVFIKFCAPFVLMQVARQDFLGGDKNEFHPSNNKGEMIMLDIN